MWRAVEYASLRAGMTQEALTGREGKEGISATENEVMPTRVSFPPNDDDQYYKLPPLGSAHAHVTEQAVERALYPQSEKNAPGPDKLSFGAIWLRWTWDKKRIVGPMKEAIPTGRHPAVWKRAGRVVIRKTGKDDHTKLKAYRSISLVSCMRKVVENVVTEVLSEEAK